MHVAFDALELRDAWLDSDSSARWRLNVALSEITGTESCSLIYFELDPGCRLARHTDSAEEIVLVLTGSAIARLAERELEVGEVASWRSRSRRPMRCATAGPGSCAPSASSRRRHP